METLVHSATQCSASTCRLGPFGASMSHGVTASESPLYMDLAGRAFFSLSHGGHEPAQVRHLSGVCLSIWHEYASLHNLHVPLLLLPSQPLKNSSLLSL